MSVSLRPASVSDSEFAYRVRIGAFRGLAAQHHAWDEDEERRAHNRRFREHVYRIIQVDGRDVGVLVTGASADCLNLYQLFVLPSHQGEGVGSASMRVVIGEAEAQGLPIRLRVLKVNPRAQAFFARFGFEQTGASESHVLMEWSG